MRDGEGPQFPSAAFLWPTIAARQASEFASLLAKEIAGFAAGPITASRPPEPEWTTPNQILLELGSVRLRDFSSAHKGIATLICAPFALHGAVITDLAPAHSLVAALRLAGLDRLFVADWRSATSDMRFRSIDDYLADLNVMVDELGGSVDLIGLCQGGWLALIYAARFPAKVRKLVLAGAPIDVDAGASRLSEMARNTPMPVFKELVELGDGVVLGQRLLQIWDGGTPMDAERVHRELQSSHPIGSVAFDDLESRFQKWQAWTLDLPGTYYLQVVEQLFKQNQLPSGSFRALGRKIDFSRLRCPLFLLAASEDDIVAAEQLFAVERLVDRSCPVRKQVVAGTHLGLFMGRETLSQAWPQIARWIASPAAGAPARRGAAPALAQSIGG